LNSQTHHFLNHERLNQLKRNSILINTARGEIIDEKVLIRLLKRNRLMAIGLDVFENEPTLNPELLRFSNVIVLPHLGSATHEARDSMAELAINNVIKVLSGKPPISPVF
jgi:glyoxylate reductase